MSDSNFTTPEQRAARDALLAEDRHAMELAGEVASLAMDNKALLAALRDALGFLDVSDVRRVWAKKGESAALNRVLNNARKLARG